MTITEILHQHITQALKPEYLEIINESGMHHGPIDAETHFKVIVVSEQFVGLSLVRRHQQVYAHAKVAMDEGLHALSLHTFSPEEWKKKAGETPETPNCRGGIKHEMKLNIPVRPFHSKDGN